MCKIKSWVLLKLSPLLHVMYPIMDHFGIFYFSLMYKEAGEPIWSKI